MLTTKKEPKGSLSRGESLKKGKKEKGSDGRKGGPGRRIEKKKKQKTSGRCMLKCRIGKEKTQGRGTCQEGKKKGVRRSTGKEKNFRGEKLPVYAYSRKRRKERKGNKGLQKGKGVPKRSGGGCRGKHSDKR